MRRVIHFSSLLIFGAWPITAQSIDPWLVLKEAQQGFVEAGPTRASFTRTLIVSGFSSGDTASGRLALSPPDCIRWDYMYPFLNTLLLCGSILHSWTEGDQIGRRYQIGFKSAPGLYLLLLRVDELKAHYEASAKTAANKGIEITLFPKKKQSAELRDITLTLDPERLRLVSISYHDYDSNLTRLEIRGYQVLTRKGSFTPPSNLIWKEGSFVLFPFP